MSETGDFAKWDSPGAGLCDRERTAKDAATGCVEIFPCKDCKAPRRTTRPDGAIVYRSYSDYVG